MAASKQTITEVYAVLLKHVPDLQERTRMLFALSEVRGNESFTATVTALLDFHDNLLLDADDERGNSDERLVIARQA